jgi:hypothetical protein
MGDRMRSARRSAIALKVVRDPAENRYRGVLEMRPSVGLLAFALTALALPAPGASAQTLGEVTAATGINSTLQRQGAGSSIGALDTAKRSLASSTKPRDYDAGSSSSTQAGSPAPRRSKKIALRSEQLASSRGSWVSAAHESKGSASSAWGRGGAGWDTPGRAAGWAGGGNGWDVGGGARRHP